MHVFHALGANRFFQQFTLYNITNNIRTILLRNLMLD